MVFLWFLIFTLCHQIPEAFAQMALRHDVALDYMKSQQWDYASYEWRKLIEEDPKNIRAHLGLADSLSRAGFLSDAVIHLKTVRERQPDARLDIGLAGLYRRGGNTGRAAQIYERVLAKEPFNADAFKGLYEIRQRLPKNRRGPVSKLLGNRVKLAEQKADAAMQQDAYTAARYYRIAAIAKPSARVINNYGLALLLAGKAQQALVQFQRLKPSDKTWQIHANAALAWLALQDGDVAIREAEKAIALAKNPPDKARLYNLLGYVNETSGKLSSARFAYEKALMLDPGSEKSRLNLAYVWQQSYELEKAEKIYQAILEKEPGNAAIWNKLGFVYELQHEALKAEKAYKQAIALAPDFKDALTNLALMYQKMQKKDEADEIIKQLMEMQYAAIEGDKGKNTTRTQRHPLFEFVDVFPVTGAKV